MDQELYTKISGEATRLALFNHIGVEQNNDDLRDRIDLYPSSVLAELSELSIEDNESGFPDGMAPLEEDEWAVNVKDKIESTRSMLIAGMTYAIDVEAKLEGNALEENNDLSM